MSIKQEIEAALHAHALWRKRFMDFLSGHAPFDIEKIDSDIECDFGKWLAHDGGRHIPVELFEQIRVAHTEFHHVAATVVRHIKEKDYPSAHDMIAPDGALNQSSTHLTALLMKVPLHNPPPAPEQKPASP